MIAELAVTSNLGSSRIRWLMDGIGFGESVRLCDNLCVLLDNNFFLLLDNNICLLWDNVFCSTIPSKDIIT
jgi:hypothetical protein